MSVSRGRAGFSLVEVMLAIFILAIGILGVGAAIPVVIRDQRQASDLTRGVSALNAAESYLRARPDLNRLVATLPGPTEHDFGYGVWLMDPAWSPGPNLLWEPIATDEMDVYLGDLVLMQNSAAAVTLAVKDRIWPQGPGPVEPEYVWDVLGRRVDDPAGLTLDDQSSARIQLAVFVRRIDPNIRPPAGVSLYRSLTDRSLPISQRRLPVGLQSNTSNRRPTLNGTGEYAKPFALTADYDATRRDRIRIIASGVDLSLAGQPGQRLVDNLGNIHTVIEVDRADTTGRTMRIDPPVPGWVASTSANKGHSIRQVVLTPHVPVAVRVIDVTAAREPFEAPSGSGTGSVVPWKP